MNIPRTLFVMIMPAACVAAGIFIGTPASFAGATTGAETSSVGVTPVTVKKFNANEWGIYGAKDEYLGRLKRPKKHIRLYDRKDEYTGIFFSVTEREAAFSGEASKKTERSFRDQFEYVATRTTSRVICAEQGTLYLNVMEVFAKDSGNFDLFEIAPIDRNKKKWDLVDSANRPVGKLEKVEDRFRLFDEHNDFLGSIRDGCFRPKGAGIDNSELRSKNKVTVITPETIRLYLRVLKVVE